MPKTVFEDPTVSFVISQGASILCHPRSGMPGLDSVSCTETLFRCRLTPKSPPPFQVLNSVRCDCPDAWKARQAYVNRSNPDLRARSRDSHPSGHFVAAP